MLRPHLCDLYHVHQQLQGMLLLLLLLLSQNHIVPNRPTCVTFFMSMSSCR
jgi:hypothetical protein